MLKTETEDEAMDVLNSLSTAPGVNVSPVRQLISTLHEEIVRLSNALVLSDTKRYEHWARAGSCAKSVEHLEGQVRELDISLLSIHDDMIRAQARANLAEAELEALHKKAKTWRFNGTLEGFGWYIAFLDDAGCFSVQSDWGDYSYRWNMGGMPEGKNLVQFLAGCNDEHYILGKIARRTWFDGKRTREELLALLDEMFSGGDITEVDYDEEWDNIERIKDEATFSDWMRDSELGLDEAWRYVHMDYEPQAKAFMKEVWPRLVEQMKAA